MADFKSGHGKNWEGDLNYLVCERELANELYQKMLPPHNVNALCPNKARTALITTLSGPWASKRSTAD